MKNPRMLTATTACVRPHRYDGRMSSFCVTPGPGSVTTSVAGKSIHTLEQAAYALGHSNAGEGDVPAALWNCREAVNESRLLGEPLSLLQLLEDHAAAEGRSIAVRSDAARRWLSALWLIRETSPAAPVLSSAHWQAVVASLAADPALALTPSFLRWSGDLRAGWQEGGALATASALVPPTWFGAVTGHSGQLARLACHALLHHGGLAALAVAPLAEIALEHALNRGDQACPFDVLRSARGTLVPGADAATAWLESLSRSLRSRRALAQRLRAQGECDLRRVAGLPRCASSTVTVLAQMRKTPVSTITGVSHETRISFPTTLRAMQRLMACGIVRELTGRRSKRVFAYEAYVQLLEPAPQTQVADALGTD